MSAPQVTRWTPHVRNNPTDDLYAVAVRDDADLWLLTWVRRSKENEFFMMLPRPDPSNDARASLHADGRFHLRGSDFTVLKRERVKPDANFKGHVQMTMTPISLTTGRNVMAVCDPAYFTDVRAAAAAQGARLFATRVRRAAAGDGEHGEPMGDRRASDPGSRRTAHSASHRGRVH